MNSLRSSAQLENEGCQRKRVKVVRREGGEVARGQLCCSRVAERRLASQPVIEDAGCRFSWSSERLCIPRTLRGSERDQFYALHKGFMCHTVLELAAERSRSPGRKPLWRTCHTHIYFHSTLTPRASTSPGAKRLACMEEADEKKVQTASRHGEEDTGRKEDTASARRSSRSRRCPDVQFLE